MTTDVVVVGGGLAGLSAAAYLARGGARVVVFEQSHDAGGRARTDARQGYHFNLGPHAFYRAGCGAAILRELGVRAEGGVPGVSGGYAAQSGTLHTLPVGLVSILTTGLLGIGDKLEAARQLGCIGRIGTQEIQHLSLADWLREEVESVSVRELLAAYVRLATYTDDPERLSAGAAFDQLRLAQEKGVKYLDGGWETIVRQLRQAAESAGAEIVTGERVRSVLRDPAVRGVVLDNGQTVRGSAVLIAASPDVVAALTSQGERTVAADWAAQTIPVQASCLDIALDRLPRPKALFALGIDRPLYASVHSAVARLAPEGGAVIQLARYGGLRGASTSEVERELTDLLDMLQPGWRSCVVRQRFLPELTVSNALVTAEQGGMPGRRGPAVPDVPGLYVAGDWVGPEGMLADASLASARSAASEILAYTGKMREAA